MRIQILLVPMTMATAILACAGIGGGKSPVGDVSIALDPSTEPIRITTVPDESHAASARIGPAGGTLTATGADGSLFTLEIPSGALIENVEISMTPLASVDGLPWESTQTAAVQLEPSGLKFYDYVTLTVEPGTPIPADQQIPIGAGQDGGLYMPFLVLGTQAFQLKLDHFSSAGASKGLLASTEAERQRLGGDVESRLQSIAARELALVRSKQLAGDTEAKLTLEFIDWYFRTYREHVLKPRLDAAGQSCAAGRLAMETLVNFQRQAQLLGLPEIPDLERADDLLPKVAQVCVREEYELCRDEHVVHRMLGVILGIQRQMQLMGLTEGGASPSMDSVMAEAEDLARKCLTFELRFESSATLHISSSSGAADYTSAVGATIPVTLEGSISNLSAGLRGTSALDNTEFQIEFSTEGACSSEDVTGGGTFDVGSLSWEAMPPDAAHPYGYVKDIRLTYAPGLTSETMILTCAGFTQPVGPIPFWTVGYQVFHQSDMTFSPGSDASGGADLTGLLGSMSSGMPGGAGAQVGEGPVFVATSWEVRGEDLFATKEWTASEIQADVTNVTGSEEGNFELYHRPR